MRHSTVLYVLKKAWLILPYIFDPNCTGSGD